MPIAAAELRALVAQSKERIRTLAHQLNLSEATLIAAHVDSNHLSSEARIDARVVTGNAMHLIDFLPKLGSIMILTRNDACVSEITGCIEKVSWINTHCFELESANGIWFSSLQSWATLFVVQEHSRGVLRNSIQVFNHAGDAVVKIYETEQTLAPAWEEMLTILNTSDQLDWEIRARQPRTPLQEPPTSNLTQSLRAFLETMTERDHPFTINVSNDNMQQIYLGKVERFVEIPNWLNFLDANFNLHLETDAPQQLAFIAPEQVDGYPKLQLLSSDHQVILTIGVVEKWPALHPTEWSQWLKQYFN